MGLLDKQHSSPCVHSSRIAVKPSLPCVRRKQPARIATSTARCQPRPHRFFPRLADEAAAVEERLVRERREAQEAMQEQERGFMDRVRGYEREIEQLREEARERIGRSGSQARVAVEVAA